MYSWPWRLPSRNCLSKNTRRHHFLTYSFTHLPLTRREFLPLSCDTWGSDPLSVSLSRPSDPFIQPRSNTSGNSPSTFLNVNYTVLFGVGYGDGFTSFASRVWGFRGLECRGYRRTSVEFRGGGVWDLVGSRVRFIGERLLPTFHKVPQKSSELGKTLVH